jgi:predicted RNA-binding Zn-ribbon protein involved in translation (DUF1610 family)
MSFSRIMAILLSLVLAGFGLLFLIAAVSGNAGMRLLIAAVLLGAAAFLLVFAFKRPAAGPGAGTTIEQKVEISGNVRLETMKCQNCGAELSKDSVSVAAGAVFIKCPYCGGAYQIEEEPKW